MGTVNARMPNEGDWSRASLDLMRFALAMVVVLGHITQPIFQSTWPDLTPPAHMAVGGFFVLSGYTIRAVTSRNYRFDVSGFFADRASRLLSVSILALFVTIFADTISAKLAPDFYARHFGNSVDMPYFRVLANLFMVSQIWGLDISPFSNNPFWSLSYEAGFYAIWACYLYWKRVGGSIFFLIITLLLLGPNILFMLPFWLLGTLLFDLGRLNQKQRNALSWMIIAAGLLLLSAVALDYADTLVSLKKLVALVQTCIQGLFKFLHVNMSRIAVSIIAGALISFFVLIPGLTFADWLTKLTPFPSYGSKLLTTLGDLTFPLYLLHFPIMVLARAGNLYNPNSSLDKILLVLATLIVAFVSIKFTDPLKLWMRTGLRNAFRTDRAIALDRSRSI